MIVSRFLQLGATSYGGPAIMGIMQAEAVHHRHGAEVLSYPDGGNTPFRGEKATNWEGALPGADGHPLAGRDQARHDRHDICAHDESGSQFQTANQLYFIVSGQAVVARWLATFKDFPPRQKPASNRRTGK